MDPTRREEKMNPGGESSVAALRAPGPGENRTISRKRSSGRN